MIKQMMALDWRAMKYYQIRGFLLPIGVLFFGVVYSPLMVIPFLAFLSMSFSVNPFAVEEQGELNNLYLTLPVKREQIVIGRYALSLTILLTAIAVGIPMMALTNTIAFSKFYVGAKGVIAIIAMSFFMYSVVNLFMYPILFKMGYQKGKMWGFYVPAVLFSLGIVLGYYAFIRDGTPINFIAYLSDHIVLVSVIMVIISMALLSLSCAISIRFYSKRDF